MLELSSLLRDFGPIIGIVLFFIWRDWKREDKLQDRVTRLETYQQESLVRMVADTSTAIAQNTACLKQCTEAMNVCRFRNA